MKINLIFLVVIFLLNSCSQNSPPPPTPGSIMNDVTGAIGGLEIATGIFGPPVTPAQAACYAAFGAVTGLSASGWFSRNSVTQNNQVRDIIAINEYALKFYDSATIQFAFIGQLHNEGLNSFANYNVDLSKSNTAYQHMKNFLDTSRLTSGKAATCSYGISSRTQTLIDAGIESVDLTLTLDRLNVKYDSLLGIHPEAQTAINIIKDISVNLWHYKVSNNITELENYLRIEAIKINSNRYNLDLINHTYAITMINVMVYSYSYWR